MTTETEAKTLKTEADRDDAYLMQVADTILRQMGGAGKLKAMINARSFIALDGEGGLKFRFSGCRKANTCVITHDSTYDVYTFRLYKLHRDYTSELVYDLYSVYADMLVWTFERETGLDLSL